MPATERATTWAPFLSAFDPAGRSDTSIDPLGLQLTAGRLADTLLPGFSVRIDRLRALTLATLTVQLSRELAPATERAHGYRFCIERLILHALAAEVTESTDDKIWGFPGRSKAVSAALRKEPLTRERYLKGPGGNGLVGVYATLARSGKLLDADLAVQTDGRALLDGWQRDFDVDLTDGSTSGDPSALRRALDRAVRWDMEDHRFEPSAHLREELFRTCRLDEIGAKERKALEQALFCPENRAQSFVLGLLRERQAAIPRTVGEDAEAPQRPVLEHQIVKEWHRLNGSREASAVAAAARAISAYEHLCGHLMAAFDAFRWVCKTAAGAHPKLPDIASDQRARPVLEATRAGLADMLEGVQSAVSAMATQYTAPAGWTYRKDDLLEGTEELAAAFSSVDSVRGLLSALVSRHQAVQKAKRKPSWLFEQGGGYRFVGGPPLSDVEPRPHAAGAFVHPFRLVNALSVLRDLEG